MPDRNDILAELLQTATAKQKLSEAGLESSDVAFSCTDNPALFEAIKAIAFSTGEEQAETTIVRNANQKIEERVKARQS